MKRIDKLIYTMPHTLICRAMRLDKHEIRKFWLIYSTAAWFIPFVHWFFAGYCVLRRQF